MFSPLEPRRRGFNGRPLAALLFAVATGLGTYYGGRYLHLNDDFLEIAAGALAGGAALLYYALDRPKPEGETE
jgi:hypothetical protein